MARLSSEQINEKIKQNPFLFLLYLKGSVPFLDPENDIYETISLRDILNNTIHQHILLNKILKNPRYVQHIVSLLHDSITYKSKDKFTKNSFLIKVCYSINTSEIGNFEEVIPDPDDYDDPDIDYDEDYEPESKYSISEYSIFIGIIKLFGDDVVKLLPENFITDLLTWIVEYDFEECQRKFISGPYEGHKEIKRARRLLHFFYDYDYVSYLYPDKNNLNDWKRLVQRNPYYLFLREYKGKDTINSFSLWESVSEKLHTMSDIEVRTFFYISSSQAPYFKQTETDLFKVFKENMPPNMLQDCIYFMYEEKYATATTYSNKYPSNKDLDLFNPSEHLLDILEEYEKSSIKSKIKIHSYLYETVLEHIEKNKSSKVINNSEKIINLLKKYVEAI